MTARRPPRYGPARLGALVLLGLTLLLLPAPTRAPTSVSLVAIETATALDFGDGVVWVLALGSDAKAGQDVMEGRADAIHLVAIDVDTGSAVALGIPRDSWVNVPSHGFDRINVGLALEEGGPELMARLVQDLTLIAPQYVVTAGFDGFADMVDAIGPLTVMSARAFEDSAHDLSIRRGANSLNGAESVGFARSRFPLPGGDFERSANHHALLEAILRRVREREDEEGFLEAGAVAAWQGLETAMSPADIYRFAHAVSQIRPSRVSACVISGVPGVQDEASIVYPDVEQARRLAADAGDDATLERGCG